MSLLIRCIVSSIKYITRNKFFAEDRVNKAKEEYDKAFDNWMDAFNIKEAISSEYGEDSEQYKDAFDKWTEAYREYEKAFKARQEADKLYGYFISK